jgi:hypothetical protein
MEKFTNVNGFNPEHKGGDNNDCLDLGKGEGAQIQSPQQNCGWGPDSKPIYPEVANGGQSDHTEVDKKKKKDVASN